MGSIAQAVSTSVASATNSPNTEPAATQAANGPADVTPFRAHDTVDLTETGSRNVSLGQPGANVAAAFQVAYFPPSSSPDARLHGSNSTNAAQAAVSPAVGVRGSSPPHKSPAPPRKPLTMRRLQAQAGSPRAPLSPDSRPQIFPPPRRLSSRN